jgi:hypothetical protein
MKFKFAVGTFLFTPLIASFPAFTQSQARLPLGFASKDAEGCGDQHSLVSAQTRHRKSQNRRPRYRVHGGLRVCRAVPLGSRETRGDGGIFAGS